MADFRFENGMRPCNGVPVALTGFFGLSRKDIIGIVLVKELILIDKAASVRVGDLKMRSAPYLKSDTRLYDMLRLFETGRCHMAVLVQAPKNGSGEITHFLDLPPTTS